MAKVLVASVVVALMVAVAGATPSRASAGVGGSPGARSAGDSAAECRFGRTAGITDGTSNTIVTRGGYVLSRKAGGGQQEYILVPPTLPAPPFVPMPYPVSSTR